MNTSETKVQGTVKFYNRAKGFGFIQRAGERDVFVHAKDLPTGVIELFQEQKVAFVIDNNHKGPRATDIEVL